MPHPLPQRFTAKNSSSASFRSGKICAVIPKAFAIISSLRQGHPKRNYKSMTVSQTVGVIGGSGQLGGAIVRGWLRSGCIAPEQLWISNRSGKNSGFDEWSGITFTTSNQDLVDACQVILLSVPPHLVPALKINAENRLVISVMAGVSIDMIGRETNATRIIRAMSNSRRPSLASCSGFANRTADIDW